MRSRFICVFHFVEFMQTKILCQFAKDSWRSATKQQSCNENLTTVSHVRRTPKAHENAVPLP
ncbi:MAG: hypothetical protein DMG09_00480 [Acidobacteria bacterium]|nr:MAG: hypothetical protein DMG09_00480 [Acidobacteriota bacterium]